MALVLSLQMYRFEGKLIPGTTDYKAVLKAFATEEYAGGTALEVPPVALPFDWLSKLAHQKLATVKTALETQVRFGARMGAGLAPGEIGRAQEWGPVCRGASFTAAKLDAAFATSAAMPPACRT